MHLPPRHAVYGARVRGLALAAAASLVACSTQTPQVFSEQLLPTLPRAGSAASSTPPGCPSTASGTVSICTALAQAEQLQSQYVRAVKELSELGTGTSAALIALSALGLLKVINHPNGADMAGIGVVGSATYAYGSSMGSRPRQQLFLAGAQALNCAMAATRPYVLPTGWLRADISPNATAAGEPGASTETLADNATQQLVEIDNALAQLQPFNRPQKSRDSTAPRCVSGYTTACGQPDAPNTTRNTLRALCLGNAERNRCTGPVERIDPPSPEVVDAVVRLQGLHSHLRAISAIAYQQASAFGQAGNQLQTRTVAVQMAVSKQVLATEPNLSAVLAASTAMRDTAFKLSAAPAFKAVDPQAPTASAGTGQSSGKASAKGTEKERAIAETNEATQKAVQAANSVAADSARVGNLLLARLKTLQSKVQLAQAELERCHTETATIGLALVPPKADRTDKTALGDAPETGDTDIESLELAGLVQALGLPEKAPLQQAIAKIETCQKNKLAMDTPNGRLLNPATLAAIYGGQCRG